MKAILIQRYGKIDDQVQLVETDQHPLKADEVRIQVHAASINPLDLRIVEGEFKLLTPAKFPLILGNDLAGTIVEVGAQVTHLQVGDEVYAKTDHIQHGAFAEFCVVSAKNVALKPKNLSMQEAASLPLVALTAWQALVELAELKAGQKVLIHAGSGGVGSVAIQLAKHLGAYVATTTSAKNSDWVKDLGADLVIDYKTTDFAEVTQGYDVVLDTQGGEILEKSIQVLQRGGRVISIAGPPDQHLAQTMGANGLVKLIMSFMGRAIRKKAKKHGVNYRFLFMQANGMQLQQIAQLVEQQHIKPIIDRIYDFAETKQAMQYVNAGRSKGKVVIHIV